MGTLIFLVTNRQPCLMLYLLVSFVKGIFSEQHAEDTWKLLYFVASRRMSGFEKEGEKHENSVFLKNVIPHERLVRVVVLELECHQFNPPSSCLSRCVLG